MSPRRKRSSSQSLVSTALRPASRSWSRKARAVSRSSKSRTTLQPSYAASPTWTSAPPRLLLRRNIRVEPRLALGLLTLVEFLLEVLGLLRAARIRLRLLDDLCLQLLRGRLVVAHCSRSSDSSNRAPLCAEPGSASCGSARSPSSANAE